MKELKKDHQRMSKLKPFIDNCNWKDIEFPSHSSDWKKFEQNDKQLLLISCLYHAIPSK